MNLGLTVRSGQRIVLALALLLSMLLTAIPAQADDTGALTVDTPYVTYGQRVTITGKGFAPGEIILIWVTLSTSDGKPAGEAVQVITNVKGEFLKYQPDNLIQVMTTPGVYYVTVEGTTSKIRAVGSVTLLAPTLQADANVNSNGTVALTFKGANFYVGENIALWVTDANGKVYDLGYVFANQDSTMPAPPKDTAIWVVRGATLPLVLSAYGNTSQQTVITTLSPTPL